MCISEGHGGAGLACGPASAHCILSTSLIQNLSSLNPHDLFFPIFFQIFSPYRFFIATQMFSLRKYFPHCVSPSQSKYFFSSYFPWIYCPRLKNICRSNLNIAQCVLCKVYFSVQPNKLRPILKFEKYYPIEHIFVPACSSARKIHFFKF